MTRRYAGTRTDPPRSSFMPRKGAAFPATDETYREARLSRLGAEARRAQLVSGGTSLSPPIAGNGDPAYRPC